MVKDRSLLNEVSLLRKSMFKQDSKDLLFSLDDVNTSIIDLFYDSCIIDFSKSKNILIDSDMNLTITNSPAIIMTNSIMAGDNVSSINNLCCKVYRKEFSGTSINASIIANDKEYPIRIINSNSTEALSLNANNFRFKLEINKSDSSNSPIIFGYSIFYKDTSIL